MLTTHFKMKDLPFQERMPADRLLQDERISQGLARLEYLAKEGTIALVTGPTGAGKSSLIKLFIHTLSRNLFHPLYIHLTCVNATALLKQIVTALGEMPKRGKERLFMQILEKTKAAELTTMLIIDEAHLLDPTALTDLRLLVSSALEERPPLKILLCGQEGLRQMLKRSTYADLVNRISVRHQIGALTKEQTSCYIDHQMKEAGSSNKVFEPEAKSLIYDYAGGLPRQINNIAIACLLNAATRNLQKIGEALVNETMTEFHLP